MDWLQALRHYVVAYGIVAAAVVGAWVAYSLGYL